MPSTEYFGNLVTNLGPLTTTFTAYASCETHGLAIADDLRNVIWRSECQFPAIDDTCMPSASEYNALVTSFKNGGLGYQGWFAYYSPASICPSDWETVGLASLGSGSNYMSATGIFTEGPRPTPSGAQGLGAFPVPPVGFVLGSLEEGEKAIWCCPRNHTVDINGVCLSTIGSWNPDDYGQFTTLCNYGLHDPEFVTVSSFDSTTWDPPLLSLDGETQQYNTFKATLTPTITNDNYFVVHSVAALALLSKDKDNDQSNNSSGSKEGNSNNGTTNGGGQEDDKDAAASGRAFELLPFTVVALGFLAGMGVLMPW